MWRQSHQPDSGPMDLLTVEGLGADLAVRPGHATAMTRRGDQVTLRPPHLLWTAGKLLVSQKASQDKTDRPFLLIKSTHAAGRYSESNDHRVKLSLWFGTYGLVGQCERERAEEGGRGEVGDGWRQGPRLSKQSVNRAALCSGALTRTTFCTLA